METLYIWVILTLLIKILSNSLQCCQHTPFASVVGAKTTVDSDISCRTLPTSSIGAGTRQRARINI